MGFTHFISVHKIMADTFFELALLQIFYGYEIELRICTFETHLICRFLFVRLIMNFINFEGKKASMAENREM
jgi:hypothetical protein